MSKHKSELSFKDSFTIIGYSEFQYANYSFGVDHIKQGESQGKTWYQELVRYPRTSLQNTEFQKYLLFRN